jgi:hypothetical protein
MTDWQLRRAIYLTLADLWDFGQPERQRRAIDIGNLVADWLERRKSSQEGTE